jgi:hypothetical protein
LLGDARSRALVADPDVLSAGASGSVAVVLIVAQTFVAAAAIELGTPARSHAC